MLLTIAVPTYNRAYLLESFYSRLYEILKNYPDKCEVLVSNNASNDNTSEICERWIAAFKNIASYRYIEQPINLGVAKNIVHLFEQAKGEYLILLPDDDEIVAENFSTIIEILEKKHPVAIVQKVWDGEQIIKKSGVINYQDAANLFYVYGNAWAAIINTKYAINSIEKRRLKEDVEMIVWPQTVIGYLAMHDAGLDIIVVNFTIGRNFAGCQNITNKKYWVTSFYGLLKAASIVDDALNQQVLKRTFLNLKTKGFFSHIFSIVKYSLVSENISSAHVRKLLMTEFGVHGWAWASVLFVCDYFPSAIMLLGSVLYFIKTGKSPRRFYMLMSNERKNYLSEVSDAVKTNKRFGNWF